jgi:hypothetical protein
LRHIDPPIAGAEADITVRLQQLANLHAAGALSNDSSSTPPASPADMTADEGLSQCARGGATALRALALVLHGRGLAL